MVDRFKRFPAGTEVVFHSYRTALTRDIFLVLDRRDDSVHEFEQYLADCAGAQIDNHTTYEVRYTNGHTLFVTCTDMSMWLGFSIEKRIW